MRNRMQDLDFEQTVAFDSVKDFEFTRKAAQKFRQVVSLDSFEDDLLRLSHADLPDTSSLFSSVLIHHG